MPATPVGNGEHAADNAAKAKAKAEATAKAAARSAAEKGLIPLTATAKAAASGYVSDAEKLETSHLILGRAVLAIDDYLTENSDALSLSIAKYCEAELPSVSGPVFGSSPAYRGLQAARCARAADPKWSVLSVNALRAAHREVSRKGALNRVYAKAAKLATGSKVTETNVTDALNELFPKDESTTRGPSTGTQAAKSGAKAKAAKAGTTRNTPTEPTEKPDLAVSGPRLKSAANRIDTLYANVSESDRGTAYLIALSVLKTCEDYGTAATRIALVAKFEEKPKARRAAKPKA